MEAHLLQVAAPVRGAVTRTQAQEEAENGLML